VQADADAREAVSGANLGDAKREPDRRQRRAAADHDRVAERLDLMRIVGGEQRTGVGEEGGGEIGRLLIPMGFGQRSEPRDRRTGLFARSSPPASAGSRLQQPADGAHQLVHLLLRISGRLALALHAVARVTVEQPEGDLVKRGLHGADLGEHVDAVAVLFDHSRHPPHLTFDAR
jgi:hypothetical protein